MTSQSPDILYGVDLSREVYESVSMESYMGYVRKLTENGSRWTKILGDVVFSYSNLLAGEWISDELVRVSGGRIQVERIGRHNSVVGVLRGWNSGMYTPVLMVGGHFDSVPNAPGANDDASGVAGMLELARVMSGYYWPLDIYFCAWNSEEIGLLGSSEVASRMAYDGIRLLQYYNMDMLLTVDPEAPEDEKMIAHYNSAVSFWNSKYYANLLQMMSQNIAGYRLFQTVASAQSSLWSRSDHYSFVREGMGNVLFIFEGGFEIDSSYHSPGDTWTNPIYNYSYATEVIASIAASMAFTMSQCYGAPVRLSYSESLDPGTSRKYMVVTTADTPLYLDARWNGTGATFRLTLDGTNIQSSTIEGSVASKTRVLSASLTKCRVYEILVEPYGPQPLSV
ncbi:MAG: M28 family metallopeptidase, partial [Candidatus Thorarchaeota archaeon]